MIQSSAEQCPSAHHTQLGTFQSPGLQYIYLVLKLLRFILTFIDDSEACSFLRGLGSPPVTFIIILLDPHPKAGRQNAKEINHFYCNSPSEKMGFTKQIKRAKKLTGVTFSPLKTPNFLSTLEQRFPYNYRNASFVCPAKQEPFHGSDFSR